MFTDLHVLSKCFRDKLVPKRIFDINKYPFGKYGDDSADDPIIMELKTMSQQICGIHAKVNELYFVALRNR